MKSRQKTGIDIFRVIAALLVVAIHTYPLASMWEAGDFFITRVLGRVAVPFFFMASGYFLLPEYFQNKKANCKHILMAERKILLLYAAATLLYLPVNIYAGRLTQDFAFPRILQTVLLDGTFYHLWYLPAAMIGMAIVVGLSRKFSVSYIFLITILLYFVGLMGDSYYGLAVKITAFQSLYDFLFQFMEYTRNGLFTAPIFLCLGGVIGMVKRKPERSRAVKGLILSFILMTVEASLLHVFEIPRHDSMYIALVAVMCFLFCVLLCIPGPNSREIRDISTFIYIIHPLMIILVRGFAELTGLTDILVQQSLVHYIVVCFGSFLGAVVVLYLVRRIAYIREGGKM